ncbi:MAG: hypothetical protein QOH78_2099, partial [Verrucomicrobiota bacterium]
MRVPIRKVDGNHRAEATEIVQAVCRLDTDGRCAECLDLVH